MSYYNQEELVELENKVTSLTEHSRLLQLENEQLAKDKAELVEALEVMVISYSEKDSYDNSPLPVNEQDADMAMVIDLLEKHKCD